MKQRYIIKELLLRKKSKKIYLSVILSKNNKKSPIFPIKQGHQREQN